MSRWRPFDVPSNEIKQALDTVAAVNAGWLSDRSPAERCQRRAAAIEEMAYEEASAQFMPEEVKYQRLARYRLSGKRRSEPCNHDRGMRSLLETSRLIDREHVEQVLRTPCSRGASAHGPGCKACCGVQSFQLHDVLNWKTLWASLPASVRNQRLLEHAAGSLADWTGAPGDSETWVIQYKFFGGNVCKVAFLALSGSGSSSLEAARKGALKGKQNCATLKELGLTRSLGATNKENVYVNVRQWLEWYAASHAELSPSDFKAYLPTGRRGDYYWSYRMDALQPGRGRWPENSPLGVLQSSEPRDRDAGIASQVTFLQVWRWEVPWLIVHHGKSMFTQCSVCSYLKLLIEQCPKSEWQWLDALKTRLGNHFQFQASHSKQCPVSAQYL